MEALEFLTKVEGEQSNIADIRSRLLMAETKPLTTGLEGYDDPKSFGVYRKSGGKCLGVVGDQFVPANLELFLNNILESIYESKLDLDTNKLTYHEYAEGKKVAFRMSVMDFIIGKPERGDVTKLALSFRTGFDGLTKFTITSDAFRLWCKNGAGSWESETVLSCKNTKSAEAKVLTFGDKIIREMEQLEDYQHFMEQISKIEISPEEIEVFKAKLLSKDEAEMEEIRDKAKGKFYTNLLKLDTAMDTEIANTDSTLYSVLQGVTRHSTHNVAKNNFDKLHFRGSTAFNLNFRAHELIREMAN